MIEGYQYKMGRKVFRNDNEGHRRMTSMSDAAAWVKMLTWR
jgi:hypothetical protein